MSRESDSSSSSDSSASSLASVATVRPSSRDQQASPTHWTKFFAQELWLHHDLPDARHATYHVYITPPSNKGPLFVCHHGAGASGLSFAVFAQELQKKFPDAGVLSLEARGHGSVVMNTQEGTEVVDFSLDALAADVLAMLKLTAAELGWNVAPSSASSAPPLPPLVLVGHSLGGAVVTTVANDPQFFKNFGQSYLGFCVIDVVEGSAIEALQHMHKFLSARPKTFRSVDEAIQWHIRTRAIRDLRSAEVSVPSLLVPISSSNDNAATSNAPTPIAAETQYTWRTDLQTTSPWWSNMFTGMSSKFLRGRGAKLLILAGTDRLDKELMIGQMQGKFQLLVVPEAGHYVHEDVPEKTAEALAEFARRNDRSQMVLPPKVSDLLKAGKKV